MADKRGIQVILSNSQHIRASCAHAFKGENHMKLTRRIAFAWAAAAMLAGASSAALADIKFGVAVEPYPPFSSKDASGKWVGWEIDLMDAVCAQMN